MRTDKKFYIEKMENGDLKKVTTTVTVEEEVINVDGLFAQRQAIMDEMAVFVDTVVKPQLFLFEQRIMAVNQQIKQAKNDGAAIDESKIEEIFNDDKNVG